MRTELINLKMIKKILEELELAEYSDTSKRIDFLLKFYDFLDKRIIELEKLEEQDEKS